MIRDEKTAALVSEAIREAFRQLDESARFVRENCDQAEVTAYLNRLSPTLGTIIFDLMEPLYLEHPSLKPDGWEQ